MHTGIISFCDRVGYNIKSTDTKQTILNHIETKYHIRILQKQWIRVESENLPLLHKFPHSIALRSNGNPYFMYFGKYQDVNTIFYIDKKIQPGYQVPRIILGRGRFEDELFKDTILDVEMVKDTNGGWICLIHDLIVYRGNHLRHTPLTQRLQLLHNIFTNLYVPDDIMDVCLYHIKQYHPCTSSGFNELLEFSKQLPYTTRGIYFVPNTMNQRQKLFNFDESIIKKVIRKVKDNPEFQVVPTETKSSSSSEVEVPIQRPLSKKTIVSETKEGEAIFYLKKTESPDIYDIYRTENGTHKEGTACVASLNTSKLLRNSFRDATVAMSIPFRCQWNESFQKWMPIQAVE
jgi:hypothetical protein